MGRGQPPPFPHPSLQAGLGWGEGPGFGGGGGGCFLWEGWEGRAGKGGTGPLRADEGAAELTGRDAGGGSFLHGRRRRHERRAWPARRPALTEVRGREEGGRDAGRPGPLAALNPLCAGSSLGPVAQTGPVHPGNFPRIAAGGGARVPWPQSPSPPSAAAHQAAPSPSGATVPLLVSSPQPQPWEALPDPFLTSDPLPSWFLQPRRAPASALPGDPCPAALGQRLSLHHQRLSPLSPTWHCPLATPSGPVLSNKT